MDRYCRAILGGWLYRIMPPVGGGSREKKKKFIKKFCDGKRLKLKQFLKGEELSVELSKGVKTGLIIPLLRFLI